MKNVPDDICHHRASFQKMTRYISLLTGGRGIVSMEGGECVARVPAEMIERISMAMSIAHPAVRVEPRP